MSLTCAIPFSRTIAAGSPPCSSRIAKTSFALGMLIALSSTSRISPASASGFSGSDASSASRSDSTRSTSVITQFDAAFALPLARATASKKSATALSATSTPAS